jgi:hypothetical protein
MAKKKPIVSKEGQWKYPGQETIIPNANGRITMQGVPYPVLGIDDLGHKQMMMPGMEYQFPGNSVYEIPMAKNGGTKKVKIHSLPKAQNGGRGPASFQDSLDVANSAQQVIDWYKSQGYYGGSNVGDKSPARSRNGVKMIDMDKINRVSDKPTTPTTLHVGGRKTFGQKDDLGNGGFTLDLPEFDVEVPPISLGDVGTMALAGTLNAIGGIQNLTNESLAEWESPYRFRQYADDHKKILNTDAPKALYDTRIDPRSTFKLQGTAPGYFSGNADIVDMPIYEKFYTAPWSVLSPEDKRKRLEFGILEGTPYKDWNDVRLINSYPDLAMAHGGRRQYDDQTIKNAAASGYAPTQEGAAQYEKNKWAKNPRVYDAQTIANAAKSGYPATQSGAAEYELNNWQRKPSTGSTAKKEPNPNTDIGHYMRTELGLDKKQSSYAERKKLAEQYGIKDYNGSAKQNIELLNKIKSEKDPADTVRRLLAGEKLEDRTITETGLPTVSQPEDFKVPYNADPNRRAYPITLSGDAAIDRMRQELFGNLGKFTDNGKIPLDDPKYNPYVGGIGPKVPPVRVSYGKFQNGGDISVPDLRRVKINALPKAQYGPPDWRNILYTPNTQKAPEGYVKVPDVVRQQRIAKGVPENLIPQYEKIEEKKISPELQTIIDKQEARSLGDIRKAEEEKRKKDIRNYKMPYPNDPAGLPSVPIFEAALMAPVALGQAGLSGLLGTEILGTGVTAGNIANPLFATHGVYNFANPNSDFRQALSKYNNGNGDWKDVALEGGLNLLNFAGAKSIPGDIAALRNAKAPQVYRYLPEGMFSGYSKLRNPNNSYRVAGIDNYEDFLNVGRLRSVTPRSTPGMTFQEKLGQRPTGFPSFQKGWADLAYAPADKEAVVFETSLPTFKRGELNPVTGFQIKGRHYAHRVFNPETGDVLTSIPAKDIKVFEGKPHWLKGHKELTPTFKSEPFESSIDWAKWNPETAQRPELLEEYNAIEQAAKENGTWMKNPDGSDFVPSPLAQKEGLGEHQFIMEQSQRFKQAYPEGFDMTYRGFGHSNNSDFSLPTAHHNVTGDKAIFTSNKDLASHYTYLPQSITPRTFLPTTNSKDTGVLSELIHPAGNGIVYDASGDHWTNINLVKNSTMHQLNTRYDYIKKYIDTLKQRGGVDPESIKMVENQANDILKLIEDFNKPHYNWEEFAKMRSKLGDFASTDGIARFLETSKLNKIKLKNIDDPILGDVTVINNRPGNFLKSRIGNVGDYDLNNPNIFKTLLPPAVLFGAGAMSQQKEGGQLSKEGGPVKRVKIKSLPNNWKTK